MKRNNPSDAAVFVVNLGKNLIHAYGADAADAPLQKAKSRRDTVLTSRSPQADVVPRHKAAGAGG